MKVALLSDAHGNAEAVRRALNSVTPLVDLVLFAGDAFSEFRFSNEVVELLRDADAQYVLGNHEHALLGVAGSRARDAPHVRRPNLDYVASRPSSVSLRLAGRSLLMVHATPWAPFTQYLTPASRQLSRCSELDVDYLIVGHSHLPFATQVGGTTVVNPGALGRSDQPVMGDDVSYAVLDIASGEVEWVRFPNPELAP